MAMVASLLMMRIFGNSFEIKKEINQSAAGKSAHNNILCLIKIGLKKEKENSKAYQKPTELYN